MGVHNPAVCKCLRCVAARNSPMSKARYAAAARYGKDHKTANMLPVEKQDEPIRAWKAVTIYGDINPYTGKLELRFHGTGNGGFYSIPDATMECASNGHTVPEVGCSCGFYAMNDPYEVMGSSWVCEVELYGTVIVGKPDAGTTGGYRAQKQRVLAITPYGRCNLCDIGTGSLGWANTIILHGSLIIPVCWECAEDHVIVPWDELRNACPVEWHQPFLFRVPKPEKRMQVVHNATMANGSRDLSLPAEMRGVFAPGQTYMFSAPITRNQTDYLVFRTHCDHNQDGFRLEMEYNSYRIGEWHFQVPKDAKGW